MPPPQPVAEVARSYSNDQTALADQAVAVTDTAAGRINGDAGQWRDAVADSAPQLLGLQLAAVSQADPYLDDVLTAQGAPAVADAAVNTAAFVDLVDGGGSWMRNLVFAPPSAYRDAIASGAGDTLARQRARFVANSIVLSGMQDAARSAVTTAMATRPAVQWYVRALNGVSCGRCAILAGRRYRVSAFRRHPRCDCYMIPAAEDAPGDWTTDPAAYFRSLSREQQDAVFTASGAEAIRLGGVKEVAINQVVNAYQGVTTVQAYGRQVQATTTGTSVRGLYGGYEVQPDGSLVRRDRTETTRRVIGTGADGRPLTLRYANAPRLMPDEIFQLAEVEGWDRAEVLRQLRRFAYIV